ncbi:hypothetical protein CO172_02850 [Candidatus Uhrbacteria bacterium CG_4_9_14_3_um_filter_36_7]|uniref:Barstar (barnase inhibitor) domain-containing protein n=1 Tax=Candidatus Uhrbacteria bacterium CG_4_9_14_3_um_filter_36_7 TaxID=1975033 RepID=A0A2M7XH24_9BACT|nr:MAG: hypothetical protein CO172_02850 [Candidatus Uhrbacteria bacterium CG_4_9_14_3_um_filter_36_7]
MFLFLTKIEYQEWQNHQEGFDFVVIRTDEINTVEKLLEAYHERLQLPYMGRNFNSLWDVLFDPFWMCYKRVIIVHKYGLPDLNDGDLRTYLNILHRSIDNKYKPDPNISFTIVFVTENDSAKVLIQKQIEMLMQDETKS